MMAEPQDPLTRRLREADPVPPNEQGWRHSPEGRAVKDEIARLLQEPAARPKRGRRRGPVLLAAALLIAISISTLTVLADRDVDQLSVVCFLEPDLEASRAVVSSLNTTPVPACRAIWQSAFGTPPPQTLIECQLPDGGGRAVLPGVQDVDPATECTDVGASPP